MPWYPHAQRAINTLFLPLLLSTQATNLALLVSALVATRTLRLSELARAYPRRAPDQRRAACPKHDLLHRPEARMALPLAPGQVERRDYEYERHGAANLFVMVEPLAGWRQVAVTTRVTIQADAECRTDARVIACDRPMVNARAVSHVPTMAAREHAAT